MKKGIYAFILFCSMLFCAQSSKAQGVRYHDMIFDSVSITTVTYSDTFALQMDIYQPVGDSLCHRPLIIFAHEGSFTGGDKASDITCVTLCQNFAQRGYVTASINYRLGNIFNMALDSSYAENEVLQSISDAKAAVRYFRKDAYTSNAFRIDTNIIYGGGNSAGAVLFMHYLFITNVNQTPPALHTIIDNNGGLEGNSGNPGYSSEINACMSMSGGVNDPSFVTSLSKPIAHFQGTTDVTVPYECGLAEQGAVNVRLCGLGATGPLYVDSGVTHVSMIYQGLGHVPWDASATLLEQVDTINRNFLDTITAWPTLVYCDAATGVQNITKDDLIAVYPNPASRQITVAFPDLASYTKVQLVDGLGRIVAEKQPTTLRTVFERGSIAGGVYFIRVIKNDSSTVIRKVVFQ